MSGAEQLWVPTAHRFHLGSPVEPVPVASTVAPSDRPRRDSEAVTVQEVGIDTIAIRGRAKSHAFRSLPVQRSVEVMGPTGALGLPVPTTSTVQLRDNVVLKVRSKGGAAWACAEFSVPVWLNGHNGQPADVVALRLAMAQFFGEAAHHVDWDCTLDDLVIDRLDIARDFYEVTYSDDLLERLGHIEAQRARTRVERTKDCAGAQTLYRITDRWVTRLYDRGRRHENLARGKYGPDREHLLDRADEERNKVRYELQLRARVLRDAGIANVDDLDDERMWRLAETYFRRSRFDMTVGTSVGRVVEMAAEAEALGQSRAFGRAVAIQVQESLGLRTASRSTVARYRRLADQFGLSPADVFEEPSRRVRLDYRTGRLVDLDLDLDVGAAPADEGRFAA